MKTTALLAAFAAATAAATCPDLTSQLEDLGEGALPNAVVAAGADGLVVARANWVFGDSELVNGTKVVVPQPPAGMAHRWKMAVGDGGTTLRLRFAAPASGYAAWMATKFATDGLWRPTASESSGYVFPSQMFFKYTIEIQE